MKQDIHPGTCRECLWFLQGQDHAGQCRYNAPFAYSGPASQTRLVPLAAWPVVQYQDWCSKFTDGRPQ